MAKVKLVGFQVIKLNPGGKPLEIVKKKKSWEEKGIEVTRYMGHPTCPYCGMQDAGKGAAVRPTEIHIMHCLGRIPEAPPSFTGAFKGQASMRSVRVPVRRVIPFPDLDADGSRLYDEEGQPKTRFACSYDWKSCQSYDWVWDGGKWQPRTFQGI